MISATSKISEIACKGGVADRFLAGSINATRDPSGLRRWYASGTYALRAILARVAAARRSSSVPISGAGDEEGNWELLATPSKRLFLSIIADYDLNRSICELVDNGLDVWVRGGRKSKIAIKVTLDGDQNTICVEDNAGGLPKSELQYIVGPGQTGSAPTDETIGIFGVGTKRAVVALAQDIKISTRFGNEQTYQVDFDEKWLEEEDWELTLYQVDNIATGTTLVELQKLRIKITDEAIEQLREHLQATYAKFLSASSVMITLNGKRLTPQFFDGWSYPPGYEPRRYHGDLTTAEGRVVHVEAMAGLSDESSPAGGEYGVYFYCNDRLIARALKTFEVGFMRGYAGLPHPKVSLTKVLVARFN